MGCFITFLYDSKMELGHQAKENFLETLWDYYAQSGRGSLPWRQPESDGSFNPYKILVSELMLQQTQVARVIPKYHAFLTRFADESALARADLGEVLQEWQGLGYNRRAKFLWQAAQNVASQGTFPDTVSGLVALPGIGVNTAGAIMAYAYNQPVVFIETNVRTVYIHHFFADETDVSDKAITQLVQQTVDHDNPREFYWALMDYGSNLKATVGNLNKVSRHYAKQSKFEGSRRQVRGKIIRILSDKAYSSEELKQAVNDVRYDEVVAALLDEGMIRRRTNGQYCL
jgi:A/G-specific adenine glycosylase